MQARVGLFGVFCVLGASPAAADILHLRTGYSQECVVIKETDTHLYYMLPEGQAGLPLRKVAGITYESEEQNARLIKQWQAARAAEEAKARAAERRKSVQRLEKKALGLIEYEGEWIPRDEANIRAQIRRDAKAAAAEVDTLEQDRGHTFHNHLWMTPEAHAAIQADERRLLKYQQDLEARQDEIQMIENQIAVLQRQMIEAGGIAAAQEISKRVDDLRATQEAAREYTTDIVRAGDERADSIIALEQQER